VRVRWLRRALQNLNEEAAYIATDDPRAAAGQDEFPASANW
jgi:plasmid stabilization system protein ParE